MGVKGHRPALEVVKCPPPLRLWPGHRSARGQVIPHPGREATGKRSNCPFPELGLDRLTRPPSRHPLSTPADPSFLSPGRQPQPPAPGCWVVGGEPPPPLSLADSRLRPGTHLPHLLSTSRTFSLNWANALGTSFSAPTSSCPHLSHRFFQPVGAGLTSQGARLPSTRSPRELSSQPLFPPPPVQSLAQLNFETISASGGLAGSTAVDCGHDLRTQPARPPLWKGPATHGAAPRRVRAQSFLRLGARRLRRPPAELVTDRPSRFKMGRKAAIRLKPSPPPQTLTSQLPRAHPPHRVPMANHAARREPALWHRCRVSLKNPPETSSP